jgi:hypothetical protein
MLKGGDTVAALMRKLKAAWEDYMRRLTKANRESFGGGRVNCCDLKKPAGSRRKS